MYLFLPLEENLIKNRNNLLMQFHNFCVFPVSSLALWRRDLLYFSVYHSHSSVRVTRLMSALTALSWIPAAQQQHLTNNFISRMQKHDGHTLIISHNHLTYTHNYTHTKTFSRTMHTAIQEKKLIAHTNGSNQRVSRP